MSQKEREEMLARLRQRYAGRGKQGRGVLLDELCEQFGYSRRHVIKLLGAKAGWGGDPVVSKGRPPVYEVERVLHRIWKAAEQPCGKETKQRNKPQLSSFEVSHSRGQVKRSMSVATRDRRPTPGGGHFQAHPMGRGHLAIFPRCSLGQCESHTGASLAPCCNELSEARLSKIAKWPAA